jgi:hypothetical protein
MRPIVYPTALPPADYTTIFRNVFGASLATGSLLFMGFGVLTFFIVAGAVAGYGFLRAGRNRYELYDLEQSDSTAFGLDGDAQRQPKGSAPPDEPWPPSLR